MLRHKILGVVGGPYSGVNENLFDRLAKKQDVVGIFDSGLNGIYKGYKAYNFLRSYTRTTIMLHDLPSHPTQWRQLVNKNEWVWKKKTRLCEREIKRQKNSIDLVLQVGSFHGVTTNPPIKPYVIYTDGTMELSARGYPMYRLWPSGAEKNVRKKLEKEAYQKASRVLTFSECARRSVIEDFGIDDNKVVTVYAGANIKELPTFEKDYSKKTILFVGKDFDRKGGPTLIKAFKQIKKEIRDAKLIIVSEPNLNYPSRMHTIFDLFGITLSKPKINLPDLVIKSAVHYDKLIQLYKDASIFAMPSIQENFGHVFLEAMTYKLPCVGTTVDAMPEIIEDGKSGFLAPPNDHKQLADNLILLLEDENLMKKMGEQGREIVKKHFTWDLVVDRMTELFGKIF